MRELRFRLWNGRTIEPVGSITFHTDGSYHVNDEFPVADREMQDRFGGNKYFLMQWTGLKDKNGKEIFEGDIIKDRVGVSLGEVKFGQYTKEKFHKHDSKTHHIGWYVDNGDRKQSLEECEWYINPTNYADFRGAYVEVIGNIYENPALLNPTQA